VLGQLARRVGDDWQARWGYPDFRNSGLSARITD
jgi:hypothetical protein